MQTDRFSPTYSTYSLVAPIQRKSRLQVVGHEPPIDYEIMTNQNFYSEKNDIKPIFTSSKFLSLTNDLLKSHLEQCIHKEDLFELRALATEPTKTEPNIEVFYHPLKVKEESLKTASSFSSRQDFTDLKETEVKEKKTIVQFMILAKLEQYSHALDKNFPTDELYTLKASTLDSRLEMLFPFLKVGHRRRLGVIILEERGEFKRQGTLKQTQNALLMKEMNGEDGIVSKTKGAKLPSMGEWLKSIKMSNYKKNFLEAGYDDYEFIMLMMCNEFLMLNDTKLKNDIGIEQYQDRNEILTKLYRDMGTQIHDRQDTFEEYRERTVCKSCSMF